MNGFPVLLRILVPLIVLLACRVTGAPTFPKFPDTLDLSALDAYLKAHMRAEGRVGLSLAVVRDGAVVLQRAYGKASLKDGSGATTNTMFAIGSVSKQFTCAAVFLLAEDGKLAVTDTVVKYYPGLTRAADISLLDLMNHVSGYPDYYPLDFVDRRMQATISEDELLQQYAGGALDFEPRSQYSYSNTGYILLGRVVERVSGESLGAFLARRIFKPLGMERTVYEPALPDSRLARGHTTFLLSAPESVAPEGQGWLRGAGGIYSTPGDMVKWNLALIDGRVLKPESLTLMTSPRQVSTGRISEYGCGLSVRLQGGRPVWSHSGAVSGFNASSAMVPSTRSSVVVMCNLDGGLGSLPSQLLGLVLEEPTNVPVVKAASVADTVKAVLSQMQRGRIIRSQFGEEFNLYLTDVKLAEAARRLKRYGAPRHLDVTGTNERGGMEVSTARLRFASGELRVLMYRRPNGIIEQFFVSKE